MIRKTNYSLAYQELYIHVANLISIAYEQTGGRKPNSDYFPAMTVCCEKNGVFFIGDHTYCPNEISYTPLLRAALCSLGTIGHKGGPANNTIGACAEDVAANLVLRHVNVTNLNELSFTEAIQPRTFRSRPWCQNCEKIFG